MASLALEAREDAKDMNELVVSPKVDCLAFGQVILSFKVRLDYVICFKYLHGELLNVLE